MQENLARGLSVVSRAVSSRSTLPVLANVLLKTEDAGLKLTATNLEIGITYWVPGKIDEDGATTVPAKLLTDLVNSLPAGDKVELEVGRRRHAARQGGPVPDAHQGHRRRGVPGHPDGRRAADDADRPERPAARPRRDGVRGRERRGAADPDRRPGPVRGRPADARRRRQLPDRGQDRADPRRGPETSVVIPARALNELARVLADVDDPVEVVLAGARNQVLFHLDGIDLVSRLIDGQFPNYQQVMPQTHATRAVLDREELLRAVRPAALIAHESANIVKLQIGGDGEAGITVSANAEVGDHVGQVEAAVEGDGTTIAFNARYLADVLTNVDGRPVRARAQRPALARRLQADRRRPATSTSSCRSGRRPESDRVSADLGCRHPARSLSVRDLRGYAALDAAFGPGAAPRLGPERGRQDEPARGHRPARLGPLAPHDAPTAS